MAMVVVKMFVKVFLTNNRTNTPIATNSICHHYHYHYHHHHIIPILPNTKQKSKIDKRPLNFSILHNYPNYFFLYLSNPKTPNRVVVMVVKVFLINQSLHVPELLDVTRNRDRPLLIKSVLFFGLFQ